MFNYSKFFLLIGGLCFTETVFAQSSNWKLIELSKDTKRTVPLPNEYKAFHVSYSELKSTLNLAGDSYEAAVIFTLPTPNGGKHHFKVWKNNTVSDGFKASFPEIETYSAVSLSNSNVTAKLDVGYNGFNAMVYAGTESYVVDPFSNKEKDLSLVYYRNAYPSLPKEACSLGSKELAKNFSDDNLLNLNGSSVVAPVAAPVAFRSNGNLSRTYRVAVAATGEYTVFHGGLAANAASAIATTINRVNGIYERELAVSLTIVPQTTNIIFTNSLTDPYTNDDPVAMIYQNQSTITSVVGAANYDIGHVFGTNSGGIAGVGVVCNNSYKSWGVTGSSAPIGDPFDIDYVAHEMGHQFGANHTFNSEEFNCGYGNRSVADAYEPASGSTIMGYAGICAPENLQLNTDPYFHANSLDAITAFISTGTGATCASIGVTGNTPNSYSSITASYNIPHSTPFELIAPAVVDPTANELLYCWEQWDLGSVGLWNTVTDGPFFRSFSPTSSRTRQFPSLAKVQTNQLFTMGERLPASARTMNFVLTVRDIYQGKGAFSNDLNSKVTVTVQNAGPFSVLTPNTPIQSIAGSSLPVTWTVANTNVAPINASQVEIFLSTDNGSSFPTSLGVYPNSGFASVTIPANTVATSLARIKVKPVGNIFYQISPSAFSVNAALPVQVSSFELNQLACNIGLKWRADKMENFLVFEVQRGLDGAHFEKVSTILGNKEKSHYHFVDENVPLSQELYYRLKLIDEDGLFTFSNVIKSIVNCDSEEELKVGPNPFREVLVINASHKLTRISIVDITGRTLVNNEANANTSLELDTKDLAPGHYYLIIKCENGRRYTKKLIKE